MEQLHEQDLVRLEKLNKLKEKGNPYRNDFKPNFLSLDFELKYSNKSREEL